MDIIMGLLAAIFWGGTDFLVGLNARAVGVKRAVFFSQLLGFIVMTSLLAIYPSILLASLTVSSRLWMLGITAAIITVAGSLALSKAFALGKASIIAPVVTSYGVFTTALSWCSGETISIAQLTGIATCITGIVMMSMHGKKTETPERNKNNAIMWALAAALLYGTSFWIQGKYTLPTLGPVTMLWLGYATGLPVLVTLLLNKKEGFRLPPPKSISALCCASLLNLAGFFCFSWGALLGSLSIVTVISTLSGGIAAVLGYVAFKEKLSPIQLVSILFVTTGTIALHTSS